MAIASQFTEKVAQLILQRIPEQTPDAMLIMGCNPPYPVLYSNASTYSVFGWEPEDLVGKPLDTLIPPDMRANHGKMIERFKQSSLEARQGRQMQGQRRLEGWHKDNRVVPISIAIGMVSLPSPGTISEGVLIASDHVHLWKDDNGDVPDPLPTDGSYLFAIIRDAKDLIDKESAIHKEQSRNRLISLATNISTIDWELKDGSLEISPNWMQMMGYSEGDLPTKLSKGIPLEQILPQLIDAWGEYIHPDDRQRAKQELINYLVLRTEPVYDNIYRFKKKDGTYVDLWSRGSGEWDKDGSLIRFISCHTDIAELKEESRQLNEQKSVIQSKLVQTEMELNQIREQQNSAIARLDKMAGFVDKSRLLIAGMIGTATLIAPILGHFGAPIISAVGWTITRTFNPPTVVVLDPSGISTPEWRPIIDSLKLPSIQKDLSEATRHGDRVVVGLYVPVPVGSTSVPGYGIIAAQAVSPGMEKIPMNLWKISNPTLKERAASHFTDQPYDVNTTTGSSSGYVLFKANSQISFPGKVEIDGKVVTFFAGIECVRNGCGKNRAAIIETTANLRNAIALSVSGDPE